MLILRAIGDDRTDVSHFSHFDDNLWFEGDKQKHIRFCLNTFYAKEHLFCIQFGECLNF